MTWMFCPLWEPTQWVWRHLILDTKHPNITFCKRWVNFGSSSFFSAWFKASQAWRKNKMDESKHEIHSQVDAITAGTASMVNLTAGKSSFSHCTQLKNSYGSSSTHTCWNETFSTEKRTVHLHKAHLWIILLLNVLVAEFLSPLKKMPIKTGDGNC